MATTWASPGRLCNRVVGVFVGVSYENLGASTRRRGFTLLEMIMVCIIMAIVTTIAAPRYANLVANQRLDAATRRVQADLSLASRTAKYSSIARKVSFAVASDSYAISGLEDPNRTGQAYVVHLSDEPYGATVVSATFGGDSEVIYDGYGVPDSAGSVVVRVGGYQRTITIAAGKVSIGIIVKNGVPTA